MLESSKAELTADEFQERCFEYFKMQVWFDHKVKIKSKKLKLFDIEGKPVHQILAWMQRPEEVEQAGFKIIIVEQVSDLRSILNLLERQDKSKKEIKATSEVRQSLEKTKGVRVSSKMRGSSLKALSNKDNGMNELSTKAQHTPSFIVVGK